MKPLTFGSLFAGIEGFGLGLESAGASCVFQVERDKDCKRILPRHWPQVERHTDVCEFSKSATAFRPELICGGFPCQDLSVAGRRAGLSGERSGLWFEFKRIVGEFSPRWVLIENVPGLLSSQNGWDMGIILRGLGELGYGWAYRVLDAQYFGVPQRRRRVFIVGCLGDWRRAAEVLFERESLPWDSPPSREGGARVAHLLPPAPAATQFGTGRRGQDDFVTHTLRAEGHDASEDGTGRGTPLVLQCQGTNVGPMGTLKGDNLTRGVPFTLHGSDDCRRAASETEIAQSIRCRAPGSIENSSTTAVLSVRTAQTGANGHGVAEDVAHTLDGAMAPAVAYGGPQGTGIGEAVAFQMGIRRLTPTECERLQGFPDDWTRYDADRNELSDSARYRMLGNAVAVPCARWLGRRIIESVRDA